MPKIIIAPGTRFGRLVVIRKADKPFYLECQCDCGKIIICSQYPLVDGKSKSCGCWKTENLKKIATIHGMVGSPEFMAWQNMIGRCFDRKDAAWENYGGRGITVCPEWRHDFAAFFAHVDPRPSLEHSIDRIDNNRGYEPGNVKWSTRTEQARNMRTNVRVTYNGQHRLLIEVCEELGLSYKTIRARKLRGCPDSMLFLPVGCQTMRSRVGIIRGKIRKR